MRLFKRRPIMEMLMHMNDELKIVDTNESALIRLKSIIKGESSKIGDVVWTNRDDEPSVIIMFFTHDRVRVGSIYIITYQHLQLLLQFMNRGPQSI